MVITMKNKISLFLLLMLVAGVSHAELKIGYVNIQKVLAKSPQYAKANTRLETEFSPRQKALKSQIKEIQSLEEKSAKDSSVMSDEERRKLERDLYDKKRDAARAEQEMKDDFSMRSNEELGNVQKRVIEAVRALAKEESFDLLLADGVMFANDQIDVTNRVLQKMETAGQ